MAHIKFLSLFFLLVFSTLFPSPKMTIKFYVSDDYEIFKDTFYNYILKASQKTPLIFSVVFDQQLHSKEKIKKDFSHIEGFDFQLKAYPTYSKGLFDISILEDDYDIIFFGSPLILPKPFYDLQIIKDMQKHFPHFDGVIQYDSSAPFFVVGKNYIKENSSLLSATYRKKFYDFDLKIKSSSKNRFKLLQSDLFPSMQTRLTHHVQRFDLMRALKSPIETKDFKTLLSYLSHMISSKQLEDLSWQSSHLFFKPHRVLWSILIPSIEENPKNFSRLFTNLMKQFALHNLLDQIEILYSPTNSLNSLIERSQGQYISLISPHDSISDYYIPKVFQNLQNHPDIVELIMLKNGSKKLHYLGNSISHSSIKQTFFIEDYSLKNPIKKELILKNNSLSLEKIHKKALVTEPIYFSSIPSA